MEKNIADAIKNKARRIKKLVIIVFLNNETDFLCFSEILFIYISTATTADSFTFEFLIGEYPLNQEPSAFVKVTGLTKPFSKPSFNPDSAFIFV
ncbi:MAG: hypothetical protein U0354_08390 [Candidatus Sericytochromatia bacterium]